MIEVVKEAGVTKIVLPMHKSSGFTHTHRPYMHAFFHREYYSQKPERVRLKSDKHTGFNGMDITKNCVLIWDAADEQEDG